ncbi:MAG TPA: response regulator [Bacteroidales bacterium]
MKKKVLVIDDEKAIRKSFALTFEGSKCEVETAESGMEGIEKLKKDPFDLVFLDLKMPKMDGVETLRHIREFNQTVLVYIFTAFHRDFFIELEKAASMGLAFEIVQKPLDSEQLLKLVYSILNV